MRTYFQPAVFGGSVTWRQTTRDGTAYVDETHEPCPGCEDSAAIEGRSTCPCCGAAPYEDPCPS